jgi:ATP-dependent Lhr-like helicase
VRDVDDASKVIVVEPATGGAPPLFGGGGALIDDEVRTEMRRVYGSGATYAYLDDAAADLLVEGRREYRRMRLADCGMMQWGTGVLLFPWTGDRALDTLALQLRAAGLDGCRAGIGIQLERCDLATVRLHLEAVAAAGPCDPVALAARVRNKLTEKHHWCLTEELLCLDYASSSLDPAGAHAAAAELATCAQP